jgi:tetratricopeptide (TPR) repeat protein
MNRGNEDFRLGKIYYDQRDYVRARRFFERAAELHNNDDALNNLGDLYYYGLGVEQNYETARRYYERAAEQNNRNALTNLGRLYENGLGVEQDIERARGYFERARALQRNPPQQVVQPQVVEQPQIQVVEPQVPRRPPLERLPEDNFKNFVERFRCSACKVNGVNIALNPCGHLMCSSCYTDLPEPKVCRKCGTNITSTTRIFYGGYKQKYLKYKNKYLKLKI